jgi:hypothetical protein
MRYLIFILAVLGLSCKNSSNKSDDYKFLTLEQLKVIYEADENERELILSGYDYRLNLRVDSSTQTFMRNANNCSGELLGMSYGVMKKTLTYQLYGKEYKKYYEDRKKEMIANSSIFIGKVEDNSACEIYKDTSNKNNFILLFAICHPFKNGNNCDKEMYRIDLFPKDKVFKIN